MKKEKEMVVYTKSKIKRSKEDLIFDVFIYIFLGIFLLIVAYPLYFVVLASFSDVGMVNRGEVVFWVKGFNVEGYKKIFSDVTIWRSYLNTFIYVGFGTALSVIVTMMLAYPLSRSKFSGRNIIMLILMITMYFSGGMIPMYIMISNLNLRNTVFLMIILGCVSVYNVIIARTFLKSNISDDLEAAASIDGCGAIQFFIRMVLPLSKAIMAVLVLYYGVGKWNDFMTPMIYLDDVEKIPLALKLREILLVANSGIEYDKLDPVELDRRLQIVEIMKYGVMIVSTIPVLCLYPFLQKYFVKGVMIGSVKE